MRPQRLPTFWFAGKREKSIRTTKSAHLITNLFSCASDEPASTETIASQPSLMFLLACSGTDRSLHINLFFVLAAAPDELDEIRPPMSPG